MTEDGFSIEPLLGPPSLRDLVLHVGVCQTEVERLYSEKRAVVLVELESVGGYATTRAGPRGLADFYRLDEDGESWEEGVVGVEAHAEVGERCRAAVLGWRDAGFRLEHAKDALRLRFRWRDGDGVDWASVALALAMEASDARRLLASSALLLEQAADVITLERGEEGVGTGKLREQARRVRQFIQGEGR